MGDLIGLKKYSKPSAVEPQEPGPVSATAASSSKPFGSQTLWMSLLVVDSLLIAVFGSYLGAVGMKTYQQWRKPAAPGPSAQARSKSPAKVEPVKTQPAQPAPGAAEAGARASPAPSGKALAAGGAAEAKEAPAPKPAASKPAPGAAAPGPAPLRQEPSSAVEGGARAPRTPSGKALADVGKDGAAPDSGVKALPVDFSFHAPHAKSVRLAGAFLVRGGGRKDMVRGSGGDWTLTLYLKPGAYRYWFLEDGKRKIDPANTKVERGASVLVVYPK
ncbi:MAG: hypothetical protein HY748_17685 [Elusimicrobia bacterium]|nr:hypothetical protein [Elusimicrobiota bacterium]